jgi:hypothetical protein
LFSATGASLLAHFSRHNLCADIQPVSRGKHCCTFETDFEMGTVTLRTVTNAATTSSAAFSWMSLAVASSAAVLFTSAVLA